MYLSKEERTIIVDFLRQAFSPKFIYLFGSFAKGEGREDSDIDLAIYTDRLISPYELLLSAGKLSFKVKRETQIVHLKDVSTVFSAQIVGTREVLYCEAELLMTNYEIRALKDYVKLNEEREIVLQAVKRDGRIYG